jgi:hypothetical protein
MAKRKRAIGKTTIYKTLHGKQMIEALAILALSK